VLNLARDWPCFFYGYCYCAIGLAASVLATFLVEQRKRSAAITVAAMATMSFAVMSVEVRGVLFALLTSLPGLAAAIQLLIERWTRPGWRAASALIVCLIVFSNAAFAYAVQVGRNLLETSAQQAARVKSDSESWYCYGPRSVEELARLPPGRVAAFLDQGPAILAYSRNAVIAGPYHRNEQGILDTFDLFTQAPAAGANIARRRGINYVVICRTSYDFGYYFGISGRTGLLGQLATNRVPIWLSPVRTANDKVAIYRVLRDRLPR
jgi:hypothetical protein